MRASPSAVAGPVLDLGAFLTAAPASPAGTPGEPAVLHLSLQALPPGTYRVSWRAICADGHATTGKFSFVVTH